MHVKRIAAVIIILMTLFALIRIGTSTYENAVRETRSADSKK